MSLFSQNDKVPVYCVKVRAGKDIDTPMDGKVSAYILWPGKGHAECLETSVHCLLLDLKLMDMRGMKGEMWIAGKGIYQRSTKKRLGLLQYGGEKDLRHTL